MQCDIIKKINIEKLYIGQSWRCCLKDLGCTSICLHQLIRLISFLAIECVAKVGSSNYSDLFFVVVVGMYDGRLLMFLIMSLIKLEQMSFIRRLVIMDLIMLTRSLTWLHMLLLISLLMFQIQWQEQWSIGKTKNSRCLGQYLSEDKCATSDKADDAKKKQ